jgi:hypothetical protein
MEMAVNSAINIEKSISQSELCKTDAEIEAAANWEKQQANIKAEEENKISADKLLYGGIDKLVNAGKWEDADSKIKALNFPSSYPNYSKVNEKLVELKKEAEALLLKQQALADSILYERINLKLAIQDLDSATILYSKIVTNQARSDYWLNNFIALKKTIQAALNEKYSTEIQTVDGAAVNAFINDNKTKLLSLEPTNLEITKNQDGTFDGITSDYITKSIVPQFKTINGFSVPLTLRFEVKITRKDEFVENSEKLFINTYNEVRKKNNGKLYVVKSILDCGYLHPTVKFFNPEAQTQFLLQHPELKGKTTVKKGYYLVIKSRNSDCFANLQKLGSFQKEEVIGEYKLNKRIPKIITRSSIILGAFTWMLMRVNETSKVIN